MADVVDKDQGFRAMARAAARADGLELRNGILDHRLRYPPKGQFIAKVAGIHGIHRAISHGYEDARPAVDAGMAKLHRALQAGKGDPAQLIQNLMGKPIQAAQRAALERVLRRRSGRMRKAIRSTVFESGRIGARGSASAGTVAAGDNPKRPKATEAV